MNWNKLKELWFPNCTGEEIEELLCDLILINSNTSQIYKQGVNTLKSKDMIDLIIDVERHQHGITKLYPSRIYYFQRTNKYDKHTFSVDYDEAFEKMIEDFEVVIGGKINRPTAKKILNNWFAWALEQRIALLRLQIRSALGA